MLLCLSSSSLVVVQLHLDCSWLWWSISVHEMIVWCFQQSSSQPAADRGRRRISPDCSDTTHPETLVQIISSQLHPSQLVINNNVDFISGVDLMLCSNYAMNLCRSDTFVWMRRQSTASDGRSCSFNRTPGST